MSSMRHLRGMLGNCYRAAHGVADRIAKLKVSVWVVAPGREEHSMSVVRRALRSSAEPTARKF